MCSFVFRTRYFGSAAAVKVAIRTGWARIVRGERALGGNGIVERGERFLGANPS